MLVKMFVAVKNSTLTKEEEEEGLVRFEEVEVEKTDEELKEMGWFGRPSLVEPDDPWSEESVPVPFDPDPLPDLSRSKELEEVKSAQPDPSCSPVSNLCQPEQMEIDKERDKMLADFFYYEEIIDETYLYHRFRHDEISVPADLKVDKCSDDDDWFLQQLYQAQVPWIKQFEDRMELVDRIVQSAALSKLLEVDFLWVSFLEQIRAANEIRTFDIAIIAAAKLVYRLYTKESLYRIGLLHEKRQQMKQLWDCLAELGRKDGSYSEAYKEIVKLVTDENKYYLVTESDIGSLLQDYNYGRCQGYSVYYEDRSIKREKGLLDNIENVVQRQPFPTKLEDDENTRFMIKLLGGDSTLEEVLITELLAESNITNKTTAFTMDLCAIMLSLIMNARHDMKGPLSTMIHPLYSMYNPGDVIVPSQVFKMVQVAELRRMVLGSRFIGRSHLIWAFYECGFGLPPMIRKKVKLNSDQDCPSYHIYAAAIKLAERLGDKNLRLEHFIYAVLYSEDIGVDWDKGVEFQKRFKKFMIDLQRSSENSSSDIRDVEEGIAPMKKLRSADLSEVDEYTPSFAKQMPSSADMMVTGWD